MRLFGLIGKTLEHSFSKIYFTKKFEKDQITDCCYELFPIDNIKQITSLLSDNPDLKGFNVTIPYKTEIIPYLTQVDPEAQKTGAVNCVKIERNSQGVITIGYNTDIYGFSESISPLIESWHTSALILGTGGASKAVMHVLKSKGIEIHLVSRSKSENTICYDEISEKHMSTHLLIINTTPLGMFPHFNQFPHLPYEYITNRHLLVDLIYNPQETVFLAKGKQMGAKVKNGQEMLELQAEKSWEIWTK